MCFFSVQKPAANKGAPFFSSVARMKKFNKRDTAASVPEFRARGNNRRSYFQYHSGNNQRRPPTLATRRASRIAIFSTIARARMSRDSALLDHISRPAIFQKTRNLGR
jgi:hypothetical protein